VFDIYSLTGQTLRHIVSYVLLHVTPPKRLLQILVQLIPSRVY